jgi:hypothetical protein
MVGRVAESAVRLKLEDEGMDVLARDIDPICHLA